MTAKEKLLAHVRELSEAEAAEVLGLLDAGRALLLHMRPSLRVDDAQGPDGFALQFDPAEIVALAGRYSYAGDGAVVAAGQAARARGNYTRGEFLDVADLRRRSPRTEPQRSAQ